MQPDIIKPLQIKDPAATIAKVSSKRHMNTMNN